MAHEVIFEWPVNGISGKVGKNSRSYRRNHYGRWREVLLENPRKRERSSEHEKAYRAYFGQKHHEALQIYNDPVLAAPYLRLFEKQTPEGNLALTGKRKIYLKPNTFILACRLKEEPFVE